MKKFTIVGLLVFFVSCKKYDSSEVMPERIEQNYTVTYYGESNVTEVKANFYVKKKLNKNPVVLTGGASIRYANSALQKEGDNTYMLVLNGRQLVDTFTFVNNDGTIYKNVAHVVNSIPLNNVGYFYMSKTNDFSFGLGSITGNSSCNDVYMNFANKSFLAKYNYGSYQIDISRSDLSTITSGYYNSTISNSRTAELQQASDAGGKIHAIIHSRAFVVQVVE